jgi:hypothetical protein
LTQNNVVKSANPTSECALPKGAVEDAATAAAMAAAGVGAAGGTLPMAHERNHPVETPTRGGRAAAAASGAVRGGQLTPRRGGGGAAIHRRKSAAEARMRTEL